MPVKFQIHVKNHLNALIKQYFVQSMWFIGKDKIIAEGQRANDIG